MHCYHVRVKARLLVVLTLPLNILSYTCVHTFTNYCFDDDLNQQVLIVLHKMTESSFEGEEEEEKMTEASNSVSVKLYRLGKQNALISSDAEMTADLYLPMTQREYHTSIRRYKFFWRDTSMAIVV